MRKFPLLIVALIALLGIVAVGCGGGGGKKKVNIPGGGQVEVSGNLPGDFPDDFPKYKGADVQGSYSGTQGDVSGTVVSWETNDSVDDVKAFFDDQFKTGNWKSDASGSSGGVAFWSVKSADGKKAAYVSVSDANGKTSILVAIGDSSDFGQGDDTPEANNGSDDTPESEDTPASSSSDDETPPPADLPDEATLPSDFPEDRIPFPSGARVTSATSVTSGGTKSYYLEVYIKDDPSGVNDYFKSELPKNGWTESFTSESDGQFFLTYSAGDTTTGGGDSLTLSVEKSDTPDYAKVSIVASLSGS